MTGSDPFDFTEYRPDLTGGGLFEDDAVAPSGRHDSGTMFGGDDATAAHTFQSPFGYPLDDRAAFEEPFGPGRTTSATTGGLSSATTTLARPPRAWLLIAGVVSVIGIAMAGLLRPAGPIDIAAWGLAGPVAIVLLGIHTRRDLVEGAKLYYTSSPLTTWLYRGALMLAAVGVLASAWRIAEWIGHR